jgi:hypothetical protein
MNNSMCTGNVTCEYAGMMAGTLRICSCRATFGPAVDGGRPREWGCTTTLAPRDAGNGGGDDSGVPRCANGTNDGDMCTTAGDTCRLNNSGSQACACIALGNRTEWFCNN